MSKKDYLTGKKKISGNQRSHAMNHSHRVWNLNLQTVHLTLANGQTKKVRVSARTLKTLSRKNKWSVKIGQNKLNDSHLTSMQNNTQPTNNNNQADIK